MIKERGKFIVFEGIGGSGKTTQTDLAADYLKSLGIEVLKTREPGGNPASELIRKLIFELKGENIINSDHQMALFFASRMIWLHEQVIPARESGIWVLSDRCDISTKAYQGYGEGGNLATIDRFSEKVMGKCRPDIAVLLQVSLNIARNRMPKKNDDPFDKMPADYWLRVIDGYDKMARENG